jgi:hypothetical protein
MKPLHAFTVSALGHRLHVRVLPTCRDVAAEFGPGARSKKHKLITHGYFTTDPMGRRGVIGTVVLAADRVNIDLIAHETAHAAALVAAPNCRLDSEELLANLCGFFTQRITYRLLDLGYEL